MRYYLPSNLLKEFFGSFNKKVEPGKIYTVDVKKADVKRQYKSSYHNTTGEIDTSQHEKQCKQQESKIYNFLEHCQGISFTPFEIADYIFKDGTPITSIRRALTNLKKQGLIKNDGKVIERYKRPNFRWTLNNL